MKYVGQARHQFIEAHERYLEKLNSEEKEVILNFLLHMEKVIDDLELP